MEVSTNIPFSASSEHALEIEMRFALDGCVSNCVQVAFGKDTDDDGIRSAEVACQDGGGLLQAQTARPHAQAGP